MSPLFCGLSHFNHLHHRFVTRMQYIGVPRSSNCCLSDRPGQSLYTLAIVCRHSVSVLSILLASLAAFLQKWSVAQLFKLICKIPLLINLYKLPFLEVGMSLLTCLATYLLPLIFAKPPFWDAFSFKAFNAAASSFFFLIQDVYNLGMVPFCHWSDTCWVTHQDHYSSNTQASCGCCFQSPDNQCMGLAALHLLLKSNIVLV